MDFFAVKPDLVEHSRGGQDLQDCWVAEGFQDVWAGCRHADAAGFDEAGERGIHRRKTQIEQDRCGVLDGYAAALLVVAVKLQGVAVADRQGVGQGCDSAVEWRALFDHQPSSLVFVFASK